MIVHGRFRPRFRVLLSIGLPRIYVRIQNGILIEHWDVIQDEATEDQVDQQEAAHVSELHFRPTLEEEKGLDGVVFE